MNKDKVLIKIMNRIWGRGNWDKGSPSWNHYSRFIGRKYGPRHCTYKNIIKGALVEFKRQQEE